MLIEFHVRDHKTPSQLPDPSWKFQKKINERGELGLQLQGGLLCGCGKEHDERGDVVVKLSPRGARLEFLEVEAAHRVKPRHRRERLNHHLLGASDAFGSPPARAFGRALGQVFGDPIRGLESGRHLPKPVRSEHHKQVPVSINPTKGDLRKSCDVRHQRPQLVRREVRVFEVQVAKGPGYRECTRHPKERPFLLRRALTRRLAVAALGGFGDSPLVGPFLVAFGRSDGPRVSRTPLRHERRLGRPVAVVVPCKRLRHDARVTPT
mmetsp:Transcript_7967/g.18194  ORF Transcript_7967/g.18194 Transcript_7967/m.18194 type:complete len:265 (+) Transcript_7967:59-853(+)